MKPTSIKKEYRPDFENATGPHGGKLVFSVEIIEKDYKVAYDREFSSSIQKMTDARDILNILIERCKGSS